MQKDQKSGSVAVLAIVADIDQGEIFPWTERDAGKFQLDARRIVIGLSECRRKRSQRNLGPIILLARYESVAARRS